MRYDATHKARVRNRVLEEAAQAIRCDGPHRVGVAGIMARAGLTHGGFYAHFPSKSALVAEAIETMFAQGRERLLGVTADKPPRQALRDFLDLYISSEHRDSPECGCPLPALSADLPRLDTAAHAAFAAGVGRFEQALARLLEAHGGAALAVQAGSLLAEITGAVALARALGTGEQSDALLAGCRQALHQRFHLDEDEAQA